MSPNKNAISYPCEHAVGGIWNHVGSCLLRLSMEIQLPNETLFLQEY